MTIRASALAVVIIGAGPVGMAAAAHLLARGETRASCVWTWIPQSKHVRTGAID